MLSIKNGAIALFVHESGKGLSMLDLARGTRWQLDPQSLHWGGEITHGVHPAADAAQRMHPLVPLEARLEDGALSVRYAAQDARVTYRYQLGADHVLVTLLPCADASVRAASLPGTFLPAGEAYSMLLPIMQGMLWVGGGPDCDRFCISGGHTGFSMQMCAVLGESGGLLTTLDTDADQFWRWGKAGGRRWAHNIQIASLGAMRYPRTCRLYPIDSGIVPAAKRYRRRVKEKGRFRGWEEKIAERPMLERLFGSVMCFIGYCHDDVDYVAELGHLKSMGFERALVYPAYFHAFEGAFTMGGQPPIRLTESQMRAISDLGYDLAPWAWINEAIDTGTAKSRSRYRLDESQRPELGWQIERTKWYKCCSGAMAAFESERDPLMDFMSWTHYDVLTCAMIGECHALGHDDHPGRPLERAGDIERLRQTLLIGADGRRAVSSENFNDLFSAEYDIGSVKAWPRAGIWPLHPVPLTMLVYHDSILHSWWEPHNYNSPQFGRTALDGCVEYGGGQPRLMAAADALMGCPPDVFPCGAMYGWTGHGAQTFLYKNRVSDPEVQLALAAALPAARLHRRTGKQEMVDFSFLTPDGTVQRTVFADGTTVEANFSNELARDVADADPIPAESWRVV